MGRGEKRELSQEVKTEEATGERVIERFEAAGGGGFSEGAFWGAWERNQSGEQREESGL